jgi:hypothetical protein
MVVSKSIIAYGNSDTFVESFGCNHTYNIGNTGPYNKYYVSHSSKHQLGRGHSAEHYALTKTYAWENGITYCGYNFGKLW